MEDAFTEPALPECICNLLDDNASINLEENELCEEYHYECIDEDTYDAWGTQTPTDCP